MVKNPVDNLTLFAGAVPTLRPLRVALVEAQDLSKVRAWNPPPDRFSNRCSSLTPATKRFLERLGALEHADQGRLQPYHQMQVWDGVTGAPLELDYGDWYPGEDRGNPVAYMVENSHLTSALLKRLDQLGGVHIFDGAKVQAITYSTEETEDLDLRQWPIVHLSSGNQLYARLLVGADGANSPVRTFAGINASGWDYDRHGVVATLEMEGDGWRGNDHKIAYQRFLPTGPVALLPLPGRYASLVWSTTPENTSLLKSLSSKDFIAMVNAAFRLSHVDLAYMHTLESGQADEYAWRLEHTPHDPRSVPQPVVGVQEGTVASFPLRLRHADTYITERVALVGDAAHTIHPLAGQGLNQGQSDVRSLAKHIDYAVNHGQDIGTITSLEPYFSDRYTDNHIMLGFCDKLHKLFSVSSGPLVPLRSVGLRMVNNTNLIKQAFMIKASGKKIARVKVI
jgi:ubiquinone biosynthesis monooxygenase Coq6